MSTVCFIPARGGSKGVTKKNLQTINGKSLLEWAVEKARQSFDADRIIVSSDCDEILHEAFKLGVKAHKRPVQFAADETSSEDTILNFLETSEIEIDRMIFIQCTAPFFEPDEIRCVLDRLENGFDSAFVAYPTHDFQWRISASGEALPLEAEYFFRKRRQDQESRFVEAGSVYGFLTSSFLKYKTRFCGRVALVPFVSGKKFEIDSWADLEFARKRAVD